MKLAFWSLRRDMWRFQRKMHFCVPSCWRWRNQATFILCPLMSNEQREASRRLYGMVISRQMKYMMNTAIALAGICLSGDAAYEIVDEVIIWLGRLYFDTYFHVKWRTCSLIRIVRRRSVAMLPWLLWNDALPLRRSQLVCFHRISAFTACAEYFSESFILRRYVIFISELAIEWVRCLAQPYRHGWCQHHLS